MSSVRLLSEIKKYPKILGLVVLVHIGLIVLLSINLSNDEKPPMPMAQKHKIINAVAVDAEKYDERKKQKKLAVQKKIKDKKAAEVKRKKALEKKRLAEKKKAAEKKRQKEISLAKKKKADKKAKEKKARELKEKQRLEAEKKRKVEDERLVEEKRRAEEKADFERALLEEERREEEARKQAERAARLLTQRQQYMIQIAQKVENNWLRPANISEGSSCNVRVTQTMRGDVIDVRLQSCVSDNAFQRSVERAVRKASPLPMPPNPDVFDREISFTFKPQF